MRLTDISITDKLFLKYYGLVKDVVVPYQWEVLNDRIEGAEKSHCVENIKIAAGLSDDEFYGFLFQDSDLAKWLEALGYCLQKNDLRHFEEYADELIGYIEKAQEPDGYFNTYFQIKAPDRKFTNLLEAHELYCAGHLIEAAVAYYEATGKRIVLDIACKLADMIDTIFGKEPGKIPGYCGHQEIEIGLIKLYELTKNEKYLDLASFFIEERGQSPHFFADEWEKRAGVSEWSFRKEKLPNDFSYNQAHVPVRQQTYAVGHSVRAVYMYTAMSELSRLKNDEEMFEACDVLWENITKKQMYVTGSIGSTNHGEAFTYDYDLPNDTNYSETCASIGLIFFAHSMLKNKPDSKYADVLERALYNTVLASMQLDGKRYFYVNPMEIVPEASEKNPARKHVMAVRQKWHACACCPPNIARLLASLNKYIYTVCEDTVFVHLYISSGACFDINSGNVNIRMETEYPLYGHVKIETLTEGNFAIALRIPEWCDNSEFFVNGKAAIYNIKDGYAYIKSNFAVGDIIEANFDMKPQLVYANTNVRADLGKAALQRGPLVYCLEETDNCSNLHSLIIKKSTDFNMVKESINGFEFYRITAQGLKESNRDNKKLYSFDDRVCEEISLSFVPYCLWGNRENGEMICWIRV